ncbi:MAG: hemerythrin domain-containing protein [Pirellulaceae bacterium]
MATASSTRTVTVNAAFLQEIKEVHDELWQLLERLHNLVSEPMTERKQRQRLIDHLEQLRDQLALRFALEEAYGYFDDPAYVAPQLCEQASELRAEHRDLYSSACEVADLAQHIHRHGPLSTFQVRIAASFARFEGRLQRHEAKENELIQQEYGDDIGCAD